MYRFLMALVLLGNSFSAWAAANIARIPSEVAYYYGGRDSVRLICPGSVMMPGVCKMYVRESGRAYVGKLDLWKSGRGVDDYSFLVFGQVRDSSFFAVFKIRCSDQDELLFQGEGDISCSLEVGFDEGRREFVGKRIRVSQDDGGMIRDKYIDI